MFDAKAAVLLQKKYYNNFNCVYGHTYQTIKINP